MKPCELYDDCGNEVSDKSRTRLCSNCSSTRSRWRRVLKTTPARAFKRRSNLQLYIHRMDILVLEGETEPSKKAKPKKKRG